MVVSKKPVSIGGNDIDFVPKLKPLIVPRLTETLLSLFNSDFIFDRSPLRLSIALLKLFIVSFIVFLLFPAIPKSHFLWQYRAGV